MKLTPEFIIEAEANAIKSIPEDNPYAGVIDLLFDHCHQKGARL